MESPSFSVRVMLLLFASSLLVSCGGGSASSGPSVQSNEIPSIQGAWRFNSCIADGENFVTDEIVINATGFTQSVITHFESEDCTSSKTVSVHLDGTMSFSGEGAGDAQHVDINYVKARMTASEQFILALDAQGITLQERAAAIGITDINNIPLDKVTTTPQLYTIYSVEGDTLRFGVDTPSFTGVEPALRHNTLDTATYSRVISNTVVSDELSGTSNSEIIGVVFFEGEFKTNIDGLGNVIQVQVGEGTYMILKDHTAVLALDTPPADFDLNTYRLEENAEITTLQELEFVEADILPPLPSGYTFDFRGEYGEAGFGGPTFASIDFSSDGSFESRFRRNLNATASNSTGTYSIAGNTIELRHNNGDAERTVFGTDGSTIVVIGQERYTPR